MSKIELTETDIKISNCIDDLIGLHDKLTISMITESANVSASSVVKFAQKLGYSGWTDMYLSMSSKIEEDIEVGFHDFNFISSELLNDYYYEICKIINKKDVVLVSAIGDSEQIGQYFLKKLWERGIKSAQYSRSVIKVSKKRGESVAVFLLNESGSALLEQALLVKRFGYTTIAITSNINSPISTQSNISVVIANHKSKLSDYSPNFYAARLLLFIEMLFVYYDNHYL